MADNRIKLNSLGVIEEIAPQYVQIGEAVVTVKHRIPYEQMLEMIQWSIDYIINDRPFVSAPLKKIIMDFAVLRYFTNFDFDFMLNYVDMSEIYEEYDLIRHFEVLEKVKQFIDSSQIEFYEKTLEETLTSVIAYRNSAAGIIDLIAENAKADNAAIDKALNFMDDPSQQAKIKGLLDYAAKISG